MNNSLARLVRRVCLSGACALALIAAPAVAQQAPIVLDVVGGNSSNNRMLWLNFDGGSAVPLNDDASSRVSLRSFEFFKNTCDTRLDVVAADTNRGELVLYPQGRGTSTVLPCPGGQCPSRPDGLSSSNERLMAAADTGAAGTTPSVWIYEPADCGQASPFKAPKSGGALAVQGASGPATPVGGIADTEFVKVLGGGLSAGDLLVLTTSPPTIARISRTQISNLIGGSGNLAVAEILVDQGQFGGQTPTGMAFVPGTAGIGAQDNLSESEDLLVALAGGRVLKITFRQQTATLQKSYDASLFLDGLGNGSLGIAAGTREADTYMVIADRQQGRFLRYRLNVASNGSLDGYFSPEVIQSGIQHPQGVAINSDAYAASNCTGGDGCEVRRTVQLQFNTLQDLGLNTVFANIFVVPDTGRDRNGFLQLSGVSPEFDSRFRVPPSCRGFPLPDEPDTSVLIVLDINTDVRLDPGEFVQTREQLTQAIPQLNQSCEESGARLFYHPEEFHPNREPEQGRLYDITYNCTNPSRSIGREYSPIVVCANPLYLEIRASTKPIRGKLAKTVEAEVNQRTDNLQKVINTLPSGFSDLRAELTGYLTEAKKLVKRGNYVAASEEYDKGAISVAGAKGQLETGVPATTYGDLLSRLLALGFFTYEALAGGDLKYGVPSAVCGVEGQLEGCTAP